MTSIELLRKAIEKENARMGDTLEYTFKYKGYTAQIRRVREYGHLCGYVKADIQNGSKEYEIVDEHAHGGVTWNENGWIGFDCAHLGDFSLWQHEMFEKMGGINPTMMNELEIYRDFEYVKSNLQEIVDALVRG
ncbi:hypothetical protein RJB80_05135 [Staphylococcus hominis]|uniref:hypothetical protein n=1 Tax=Staphylococcus hominis TaxID=1290 RepID=UPI00287AE89E|nr:hypothetical protein [Staphylococcus hominis]MDS3887057.1 hypothetical protein [Staphylococcus hominis]MDS3887123.1 hypothetical protein [Staphylococcus hominis]